jgi:RNA polymerase sigma factor (sigma-70 family)
MSFQFLSDNQLSALTDDRLIVYLREAKHAGNDGAARAALAILVFGHIDNVQRRIRLKVDSDTTAEDLAHDALVGAIKSAFDGHSVGEFHSWLNTIVKRTIANHYRARQRRPEETRLPSEHLGDSEFWATEPAVASEDGAVEVQIVTNGVLAEFNDTHRLVIELHVFAELTAREVCDRIDEMTEANVNQIASRFRKRLRERLEAEGAG